MDKNLREPVNQPDSDSKSVAPQQPLALPAAFRTLLDRSLESLKRFQAMTELGELAPEAPLMQMQISDSLTGANMTGANFAPPDVKHPDVKLRPDPGKSPPPQDPSEPEEDNRPWRWSLVWLSILGVFGSVGLAALVWLTTLPPLPECQDAARLTTDGERLYCAQQAAQSGELNQLLSGIDLLRQWGPEHPLNREATRLIDQWSRQVLTIAAHKMEKGDLKGSMDLVNRIPRTSVVHKDAQAIVFEWRKQAQQGNTIYARAQAAMKKQDWAEASRQIAALDELEGEGWTFRRADSLAQQLGVERQGFTALGRARKVVATGKISQLGEAIALAHRVPPKTYAGAEAQTLLKQWSNTLLQAGVQQWQKGDRTGAMATLKLPPISNPIPEVKDIMQFGDAYRLISTTGSFWKPSYNQIWNLMEAVSALQQVKPDSPYYKQAQASLKDWQVQLKDLVQLKYASVASNMGNETMLKVAIGQAQQIAPKHTRRRQAQTLVAHWQQEAQRLEDQPYLARARELAKSGQIPDLQAAVAEASKVQLGRTLRGEAQDLIFGWRSQIQVIEDQPILTQARTLAQDGNLGQAIEVAAKIQPGRALYGQAQDAIGAWEAELIRIAQIAVDRPILNDAYDLADQGSLTAAINTASRIDYGRALYYEARDAIAEWERQREAIYNPPVPESDDEEFSDSVESEAPADQGEDDLEIDSFDSEPLPAIDESLPYETPYESSRDYIPTPVPRSAPAPLPAVTSPSVAPPPIELPPPVMEAPAPVDAAPPPLPGGQPPAESSVSEKPAAQNISSNESYYMPKDGRSH